MDERVAGAVVYLTGDLDRSTLERSVRAGTVQRLRRGAYAPVVEHPDRYVGERIRARQQMHAVARQLKGPLWFSHTSAALLHGLPLRRTPERTHLISRGHVSARADRTAVRHRVVLNVAETARVDTLPVTSLVRTALDCAMTLPDLDALTVLDGALAMPGVRTALSNRLEDLRGASGSAKARWRLDRADGRAESAGETFTRFVLRRHGLRVPELQIEVPTRRGNYRIDMGWPELKIGIEFDGRIKYTRLADGDPAAVVLQEKRRQEELEREGWVIIRVVWAQLHRPAEFLAEVHWHLGQRMAMGA